VIADVEKRYRAFSQSHEGDAELNLNTDPQAMLKAAESIAQDFSGDPNVLGVLVRQPMPDDPDFPETCDVELALVVRDIALASKFGYLLTRYAVENVLIDACAVSKDWILAPVTNPLTWILSLGDPRAFEVLRDYSGGTVKSIFTDFKRRYSATAALRVPYWLTEAKRRIDAASNPKLDHIHRIPEAAYALVYVTCALLDSSGRSFAGSFLKLPRKLRLLNEQFSNELQQYLPAADKDPSEAALMLPSLAKELLSDYPALSRISPKEAAEMEYNLSPLEVEYRSFVAREIAAKDKLTGLWYIRAWATYLISHCGAVNQRFTGSYLIAPKAFSTWQTIIGHPDNESVGPFVSWVDDIYGLSLEACSELRIRTQTTPRTDETESLERSDDAAVWSSFLPTGPGPW
jgi:hypothetical protein